MEGSRLRRNLMADGSVAPVAASATAAAAAARTLGGEEERLAFARAVSRYKGSAPSGVESLGDGCEEAVRKSACAESPSVRVGCSPRGSRHACGRLMNRITPT